MVSRRRELDSKHLGGVPPQGTGTGDGNRAPAQAVTIDARRIGTGRLTNKFQGMQKPNRGSIKALLSARVRARGEHLRSGSPGQGMVEYALVLMLVAMVLIVIVGVLGGHVTDMYSNVSNGVARASS